MFYYSITDLITSKEQMAALYHLFIFFPWVCASCRGVNERKVRGEKGGEEKVVKGKTSGDGGGLKGHLRCTRIYPSVHQPSSNRSNRESAYSARTPHRP